MNDVYDYGELAETKEGAVLVIQAKNTEIDRLRKINAELLDACALGLLRLRQFKSGEIKCDGIFEIPLLEAAITRAEAKP